MIWNDALDLEDDMQILLTPVAKTGAEDTSPTADEEGEDEEPADQDS